jgi:hypothetical protein
MSQFKVGTNRLFLLVFIIFCSLNLPAQRGALTVERSLDQLTSQAELIVHGHVTSAKVEPHPQLKNLTTVVISMEVEETLKGTPRKSLVFRQYIWDMRDKLDGARYKKGAELLLMLGPVSKYGLTSPVGLEQGRFRVTRDSSGQRTAVNGRGNVGLFRASEARAQAEGIKLSARQIQLMRQEQPGPLALDDLKNAIRTFAGAK